jgi:hypothetical protein
MCKKILFVAVLAGLVAALPDGSRAQDQKKKGKGKDKVEEATSQDYAQLNTMRNVIGLFTRVEANDAPTGTSLVMKLPYQTLDPKNAQGIASQNNRLQQLLAQQQQALAIQNPMQQLRKVQQLQNQINRLQQQMLAKLKYKTNYKEIELQPADKFEVRWQKPKVEFDNKGNVKEYTQEELKQLKGNDPDKVGYAGVLEDLADGQYVKVYLVPAKKPAASKSSRDAETSDLPANPFADRPRISMVLILSGVDSPADDSSRGKKK